MANETSTLGAAPESVSDACTSTYNHSYSQSHIHSTEVRTTAAAVETPKNRLKIKIVQTSPNHQVTTPMSTCSAATTATTDGTYSNRSSDGSGSSSRQSSSCSSSIRVPVPSPSRSRLDRQYAKRLAASSVFFHTPTAKSPVSVTTSTLTAALTPTPNTLSSSFSSTSSSLKIMPPPGIARDCDSSIFRPSPIIVSTDSPITENIHRTPRRFFFPSTPRQQENSRNNISFGSSSHPSSSGSGGSSSISSSRRRRNSSIINSMDMGISDRFIPSRATSNMNINLWDSINGSSRSSRRNSVQGERDSGAGNNGTGGSGMNNNNNNNTATGSDDTSNTASGSVNPATGRVNETYSTTQQNLHNVLLRSELLGENMSPYSTAAQIHSSSRLAGGTSAPLRDGINRLRFQSPRQDYHNNLYAEAMGPASVVNSFSLTPFGTASSQQLMAAPQKHRRKIAKVPFKVLDAPALQDDFYLNLVDWSSQNVLAVGLGSCVYLWSACTSKVTKLCDLAQTEDIVTSVSWAQRGTHLAVGTNKGEVQLWDTIKVKKVRTMSGHTARVGTLAWSGPTLASGSRDRLIFLRDVRAKSPFTDRLNAHRQEVCGLKWSYDEPFLASGGNDNQLHVVDSRNPIQPVHRFTDHTAAVKAIAWSPHQHGLLASGGGTADRCIRFWNTLSGSALNCVDTGSQVCNLAWSQNCNEIVSTHGYSLNQIVVWRYPSLSKVVTLTGHTYRVLYLAVSPDGSTIVTGAGDETLRFWQVFPGPRSDAKNNAGGLLFPNTLGSVIR